MAVLSRPTTKGPAIMIIFKENQSSLFEKKWMRFSVGLTKPDFDARIDNQLTVKVSKCKFNNLNSTYVRTLTAHNRIPR